MISYCASVSFFWAVAVINPGQDPVAIQHDISVYLPISGEVEGWARAGQPRTFVGEELYELIDGGAVIYYEYGFKQTVIQTYQNIDGQSLDLQIYEMNDPSGAYGIYTFQSSAEGDAVDVGDEGIVADYYLYFWKGSYLVTLIASASVENATKGLSAIAEKVDERITHTAGRPSLCNLLRIEDLAPSGVNYLKGPLALSNIYDFGVEDIFRIEEGVAGDYGDFKVFILKYEDEKECRSWYMNARDIMSNSSRFQDYTDYGEECSMNDERGAVIQMRPHRNYIFVYLGTPKTDPRSIFYKIENNLR